MKYEKENTENHQNPTTQQSIEKTDTNLRYDNIKK